MGSPHETELSGGHPHVKVGDLLLRLKSLFRLKPAESHPHAG